jgi:FtsH-binding integral membrane protein
MDAFFQTLAAKTFFILTLSLLSAYIASLISGGYILKAVQTGDAAAVKRSRTAAVVINIIAFFALLFLQNKTPLNMLIMFVFTFSSGWTLGILRLDKSGIAQKAMALTALTTFLTGMIATHSGLDFAWMGKFLFIALIILVIISIVRLFVKIQSGQRAIAFFGVIVFTGYLLFDFNRLTKAKAAAAANTWETALGFAVNIYLDIINLLLYLVQFLGGSSNN